MQGDFKESFHNVKITGFKGKMLEDGEDFNKVRDQLRAILTDQLVVTHGGIHDFKCMDLIPAEFDSFDLQSVFQKWNLQFDNLGQKVYNPIGLRRLCKHFFNVDIQDGVHSADRDAIYTMRLFQVYTSMAKAENLNNRHDFTKFRGKFDHVV
jgi:DNA polymerase III alpha subunit (gram-positive type)